jgi:thiazole/oxazole-forming peptide maturase SagD family component
VQSSALSLRLGLRWPGVADPGVGLIRQLSFWNPGPWQPPVTVAAARIAARGGAPFGVFASGVGLTLGEAADLAIGEGLERYALNTAALHVRGPLCAWRDLDPGPRLPLTTFRRFAPSQRKPAGQRNLASGDVVPWVPATRVTDGARAWVPAFMVYGGDPRFGSTVSTGAAVGTSWAAAVMTGLQEAVERHVFMSAWLTRRSAPVLRGHPVEAWAPDGTRFEIVHLEQRPPFHVVAAVLRRQPGGGFVIGAAARPDLDAAVRRAALETLQGYLPAWRELGLPRDSAPVHTLREHAARYLDGRRQPAAAFLWQGPSRAFAGHRHNVGQPAEAAALFATHTVTEPYVVDITPPELVPLGLRAAKVLLFGCMDIHPGTTPYWGADWNGVAAARRNRAPHPFP